MLELGRRTFVMGIVNVTPDSFSDGGKFLDCDQAVAHAEELMAEGVDIIDIGGESTRPGAHVAGESLPAKRNPSAAESVPVVEGDEELSRVIPVITKLKQRTPGIVLSVDTYKAAVARAAVEAGAEIVNDVSGLRWDPEMASTAAQLKCGVVLMHMRGRPDEWRTLPPADNIVRLVQQGLAGQAEQALAAGVRRESIVLDPGFGFGKNFEQNYPLISHFGEFQSVGFPLLVGTSRKSFIGRTLQVEGKDAPPQERLFGTIATQTVLVLKGAHIVRAHDVKASVEAAKIADAVLLAS